MSREDSIWITKREHNYRIGSIAPTHVQLSGQLSVPEDRQCKDRRVLFAICQWGLWEVTGVGWNHEGVTPIMHLLVSHEEQRPEQTFWPSRHGMLLPCPTARKCWTTAIRFPNFQTTKNTSLFFINYSLFSILYSADNRLKTSHRTESRILTHEWDSHIGCLESGR